MKPEGFPKSERVRKSDEFTWILEQGDRVRGRYLNAVWIAPSSAADRVANRVGVAAGKRLGNAVLRNRLKRRIREAYRRKKGELPCRGISIVFLASARMIECTSRDVEEDITQLLQDIARSSAC